MVCLATHIHTVCVCVCVYIQCVCTYYVCVSAYVQCFCVCMYNVCVCVCVCVCTDGPYYITTPEKVEGGNKIYWKVVEERERGVLIRYTGLTTNRDEASTFFIRPDYKYIHCTIHHCLRLCI